MKKKAVLILLFAVVLSGGAFFRVWRLNDRPMHADESVHAEKFRDLFIHHHYQYDPDEFHGPTLNYFTLFSAWLRGESSYEHINETTLRLTPAVFGILLILTPLLFIRLLGFRPVLFSAILIAFSPAFVFYSRYYIQETLLLFFTACFLGCLCNYLRSPRMGWLVLEAMAIGLMHATKETFVFSIAAAAVALIIGILSHDIRLHTKLSHVACACIVMMFVSVVFFSSFGSNPGGVIDSVKTYFIWAQHAGGDNVHIHPWYYYLNLLTWLEFIEPISWNEDGIVAFALIGLVFAFLKAGGRRYRCARFLAIYTVILTVIYSMIPYKTPWSMMSFVYGMALVAGFAIDRLLRTARGYLTRIIFWCLVIVYGLISPIGQSWMMNFNYSSEPTNPYVYAHTTADVFEMVDAVKKAAQATSAGTSTPIYVIAVGDDYWPLPWYLREYSNVGYWNHIDDSVCQVPIILSNAEYEQKLLQVLYSVPKPGKRHLYVPLFTRTLYLRPSVEWRGYIRKDLWDQMQRFSIPPVEPTKPKESILQAQPKKEEIPNLVKFSHRAMNANFEVFIQDPRGTYAGRAARAAFNEVDRLEGLLSRFIENSDVSRINSLTPDQEALIDEDTLQCLLVAERAWELTDGIFDVTIGDIITAWKNDDPETAKALLKNRPTMQMIELDPDSFTVKATGEGVSLDLGGVGKGYAVDVIAKILKEWGIERALIHGGASSVCALNPPEGKNGWPVILTNPIDQTMVTRLEMNNEVLSCSGLQGIEYYINPFTGQQVTNRRACWVRLNESTALADALTTAGMLMPVERYQTLAERLAGLSMMVLITIEGQPPELIKIGPWLAE